MTTAPNSALIPTFAALRFATGVASWAAPIRAARLFGLGSAKQQPLLTQLFASRELTLAVAVADPASPRLRTRALQLGLLTDALDIVATLRGLRSETLRPVGAIVTGGGAAVFLAMGLTALANQKRAAAPTA
ncbi:hypothetical protein MYCO108962_05470 [Mycobacterium colombiense]|uniref:Uncharacterized protein n=1 Tax=Mycobacterium colombiense CECT 3035 TaxID=1041522 RepID=J4JTY3_9MYCO|nr:hypothetical protein [Mycobacterium colombiense]EJO86337.1 hypothetical protein MCOL_V225377 [Mycobacterium colombiense CECT 3035]MCK8645435.1 hypothetical protein [Mycobacterium colombiense]